MAKIERQVLKIKCAKCNKVLGTFIGTDGLLPAYTQPQIVPGILPDAAYTGPDTSGANIDGTLYPIMCLECSVAYEKGIE